MKASILLAMLAVVTTAGCADTSSYRQHRDNQPDASVENVDPIVNSTKVSKRTTTEQLKSLHTSLDEMIQNKYCETNTQCKVIGTGSLPCGGSSQYFVYSTLEVGTTSVKKVADKITALEKEANKNNNRMGICMHTPPPVAECVNNRCTNVGARGA